MIKTNDIKKGTRIKLECGWYGTMFDNMKGNTRMCKVEGDFTEIGSVYSHDIIQAEIDGEWESVEHTENQLKCKKRCEAF
tara:strand:- start:32 stop:271 length:240 start_codon:yes stop_codon:yes gene_type:complete